MRCMTKPYEQSGRQAAVFSSSMNVTIVDYAPEHRAAFVRINRRWLVAYGLLEAVDEAELADPEGCFLQRGGAIFVAAQAARAVGVCAIRPVDAMSYEIAKLGVEVDMQNRGLGRRLVTHAVAACRARGASRIVLVSSSRLREALRLYESVGFRYMPMPADYGDTYQTADVFMTLEF